MRATAKAAAVGAGSSPARRSGGAPIRRPARTGSASGSRRRTPSSRAHLGEALRPKPARRSSRSAPGPLLHPRGRRQAAARRRLHVFDLQQEMLDHDARRRAGRGHEPRARQGDARARSLRGRQLRRRLPGHRSWGRSSTRTPRCAELRRRAAGRADRRRRALRRSAHGGGGRALPRRRAAGLRVERRVGPPRLLRGARPHDRRCASPRRPCSVRLAHRLDSGGAALAQSDREDDHRRDGQELRLPVLAASGSRSPNAPAYCHSDSAACWWSNCSAL